MDAAGPPDTPASPTAPAGAAAGTRLHLFAPPPTFSPWQRLYGAAHRLRWRWYRERAHRLPRPVLSIGNLHWGGGGKTPLVAAVAAHLRARGVEVCILSRGYAGRGRGVRVVSRGGGPLLEAQEAGDEPVWLAGELPGVAVVVGPDRCHAGLEALARLRPAPDVFLLDDGFSHLALHRDLDLLAFPAADPFGGGRLWPGGRLREPLAAVVRASAVLLTGAPAAGPQALLPPITSATPAIPAPLETARISDRAAADSPAFPLSAADPSPSAGTGLGAELATALRCHGFAGPGFACPLRAGTAILHTTAGVVPLPPSSKVLLVSAIARPESFAALVRELDFAVMGELRFPDHHTFPPASLAAIAARVEASGATAVLVTGKDRVKLAGRLTVPLGELPVAAEPEPAFWSWLDAGVDRLLAGASGSNRQSTATGEA
jgi:tetraacyldisaccharide-1-P 4'-kinase